MLTLYSDAIATTCRPVLLFAAEAGIPLHIVTIDLFADEHLSEDFARLNPNKAVPVLDHDGFVLTESVAILQYLADLVGSPAYPKDLRERARVNEMMDWFNTGLMRDLCYGLVYSRVLPDYRHPEPAFSHMLGFHGPRAERRLGVLDGWIGSNRFVCGREITLADYLGASLITLSELVAYDLAPWPNVARWIATMKARPAWDEVHAAFYGWRSAVRQQDLARV